MIEQHTAAAAVVAAAAPRPYREMNINLYKSHKQRIIFYYILFYWVVVQILAPNGPFCPHPHPVRQRKSPASWQQN